MLQESYPIIEYRKGIAFKSYKLMIKISSTLFKWQIRELYNTNVKGLRNIKDKTVY